jgi:peptidoglycan/LPS O-acetylase OafA/YrhL
MSPHHHPMVYVVRSLHFVIGITMTAATTFLWYAALLRVLNVWTALSLAALAVQWIIVALNRGHCPMGVVHARYGDEKTLFELVAGKQYAIHGFRNWGIICALGFALLVARVLLGR